MSIVESQKFKPITTKTFRNLPEVAAHLNEDEQFAIDVVSHVLPFRTNNYVVSELIEWENYKKDPIFALTFPQAEMLMPQDYEEMADAVTSGDKNRIQQTATGIRNKLNPHPAGQMAHNVPFYKGEFIHGMQHKYRETVLFFPSQGQTCHAYCTYCFRWAQFIGDNQLKFASQQAGLLAEYIASKPDVTDILFTGGDPMIMRTSNIATYIRGILDIPHLRNIRIGTKVLAYWPHRFLTDSDSKELIDLFKEVIKAGKHLTFMAHFTHPQELKTQGVADAIHLLRDLGAEIRTQSPVMTHINDDADAWAAMWRQQVHMGMIPYYMFVARDTGAQHYFGIPLVRAADIFRNAYKQVSGLARTVRGPSMSCDPGKVRVSGVVTINGEKVIALEALQGRNPDWVSRPFYAQYDEKATWMSDLKPAFSKEKFFYEDELAQMYEDDLKKAAH
ncbi:MAG: lysine 2,3-aminomutase [Anaerolineae bacterium]|jgi:KamA family protein|nr:lysine 2,3-aminomutase [Anaerolineae bacterium]MBT7071869.1 lysine 2,3-aminomutase [Anaerolineae bacterium]MBT7325397.1 lysine 2,3-aminomutase [Anaerolineae bacterium]